MKTLTLDLLDPIEGHDELVRKVVVREPRAADFFVLGDPYVVARAADGAMFPVENNEVIRAYLDRCVQSPTPALLGTLSVRDAMRLRNMVLDFFAEAQASTSQPPATSSSST